MLEYVFENLDEVGFAYEFPLLSQIYVKKRSAEKQPDGMLSSTYYDSDYWSLGDSFSEMTVGYGPSSVPYAVFGDTDDNKNGTTKPPTPPDDQTKPSPKPKDHENGDRNRDSGEEGDTDLLV